MELLKRLVIKLRTENTENYWHFYLCDRMGVFYVSCNVIYLNPIKSGTESNRTVYLNALVHHNTTEAPSPHEQPSGKQSVSPLNWRTAHFLRASYLLFVAAPGQSISCLWLTVTVNEWQNLNFFSPPFQESLWATSKEISLCISQSTSCTDHLITWNSKYSIYYYFFTQHFKGSKASLYFLLRFKF